MPLKKTMNTSYLVDRVFSQVRSVIYILDNDSKSKQFRLVKISSFVQELLGYSEQEMIGSPNLLLSIIHSEDRAKLESINSSMLDTPKEYSITYRVFPKHSDQHIWVQDSISPMFDRDNNLIGLMGLMVDISQQVNIEKNLQMIKQEEKLLFKVSPVILYKLQIDPIKAVEVNSNITTLLGYSINEAFKPNWWHAHVHPDDQEKAYAENDRVLSVGKMSHEYRFMKKNGDFVWLLDELQVTYTINGNPEFIIGAWIDITERKTAEIELQKSKEFFEGILNNLPIGVAVNSLSPTIDFTFINDAFPRLYRTTREKLMKKNAFWEAVYEDPAFRKSISESVLRDCSSEDPHRMHWEDIPLTRKGEHTTYINAHNYPIPDSDMMLSLVWDVTHQKNTQEQLQQSQKIESIGRLAGGIAHDYNNMLNVILGRLELAMDYVTEQEPIYQELLEIQEAANRSVSLTKQLLAFSRQQPISPKIIDLNSEVENILKLISRLTGEDIELNWYPEELVWKLYMDPVQIDQILVNLCVNSRDAIGSNNGEITIETKNVVLDENEKHPHLDCTPGDYVLLSVSDNGSGMDQKTKEKIFEPFFTTKTVGKGTGLGLPTVYGIIHQNKGGIYVYSEPGEGTTVKVYIPRAEGAEISPDKVRQRELQFGNETILLVEDELSLRKLTYRLLVSLGYTVFSAGQSSEALEFINSFDDHIDLLITDVIMPVMNGKELAERVKLLRPGIKTLYTSGYTENVISHQGVLKKGVIFIQKPFTKEELAAKVREALESNQ